jgi:hypothetical protein
MKLSCQRLDIPTTPMARQYGHFTNTAAIRICEGAAGLRPQALRHAFNSRKEGAPAGTSWHVKHASRISAQLIRNDYNDSTIHCPSTLHPPAKSA